MGELMYLLKRVFIRHRLSHPDAMPSRMKIKLKIDCFSSTVFLPELHNGSELIIMLSKQMKFAYKAVQFNLIMFFVDRTS